MTKRRSGDRTSPEAQSAARLAQFSPQLLGHPHDGTQLVPQFISRLAYREPPVWVGATT